MKPLKLGRYTFEQDASGFTVYLNRPNFYDLDGITPLKERMYRLYIHKYGDGELFWSLYKCYPQLNHVDGDKAPNTIARFAHDVCRGATVYEF